MPSNKPRNFTTYSTRIRKLETILSKFYSSQSHNIRSISILLHPSQHSRCPLSIRCTNLSAFLVFTIRATLPSHRDRLFTVLTTLDDVYESRKYFSCNILYCPLAPLILHQIISLRLRFRTYVTYFFTTKVINKNLNIIIYCDFKSKQSNNSILSEVLTAVSVKSVILSDVSPCSAVEINRRFD
jgi:hypothetical protein